MTKKIGKIHVHSTNCSPGAQQPSNPLLVFTNVSNVSFPSPELHYPNISLEVKKRNQRHVLARIFAETHAGGGRGCARSLIRRVIVERGTNEVYISQPRLVTEHTPVWWSLQQQSPSRHEIVEKKKRERERERGEWKKESSSTRRGEKRGNG